MWRNLRYKLNEIQLLISWWIKLFNYFIWNYIYLYSICIAPCELCIYSFDDNYIYILLTFSVNDRCSLVYVCGLWNQTKRFTSFLNDLARYKIFRSLDRIYKRIFLELFFYHLYFSILRAKRDPFFFFFFYFSRILFLVLLFLSVVCFTGK